MAVEQEGGITLSLHETCNDLDFLENTAGVSLTLWENSLLALYPWSSWLRFEQ